MNQLFFIRCVDFNMLDDKPIYTIFRFMCGPMAIFDESRSVCTGPELANPPCTNETQLAELFPMKPVGTATLTTVATTGIPTSPIPPIPTSPGVTWTWTTGEFETTVSSTQTAITPTPVTESMMSTTTEESVATADILTTTMMTTVTSSLSMTTEESLTGTTDGNVGVTTTDQEFGVPEEIGGFLMVGPSDFNEPKIRADLRDFEIPTDSQWGVLSQGRGSVITIQEEGTIRGSAWTLPPGAILVAHPSRDGGKATNLANGTFVTSSTTTSFPAGTNYSIILIGSHGQTIGTRVLPTSTKTSFLTIPASSVTGTIKTTERRLTAVGDWSFSNEYLQTNSDPRGFNSFGVLTDTSSDTIPVITSSSVISADSQYISGILTRYRTTDASLSNLLLPGSELVAIVPKRGRGAVTFLSDGSAIQVPFQVNPGSIFVILSGGSSTFFNLDQNSFTTTSTFMFFPAGSFISVMRIGVDGRLVDEPMLEISTGFSLSAPVGSLIGAIKLDHDRTIHSIGKRLFSVQKMAGNECYFGFLDFNAPTTTDYDNIDGIVNVGAVSFLTEQGQEPQPDGQLQPGTTTALITSGLVQITEEGDPFSSRQMTLSLPDGSILGLATSENQTGVVEGVANGFFTSPGVFTFPNGVTIGILVVGEDGKLILENRFNSAGKTNLVAPPRSTFGTVRLSNHGTVIGIGNAVFSTQYFLVNNSDSTETATVGRYGILHFKERFQLSQTMVSTTYSHISNDPPQTLIGVIPLYDNQQASISDLTVPSGRNVSIFPANGFGQVTVEERRWTSSFTVLPGYFLGLINSQSAVATNLADGFFTTNQTEISFAAGTYYGIFKVLRNGQMTQVNDLRVAQSDSVITLPVGSSLGIVQVEEYGKTIYDIGGASFSVITLSSPDATTSLAEVVGLWDIADFLFNIQSTTVVPTSPTVLPDENEQLVSTASPSDTDEYYFSFNITTLALSGFLTIGDFYFVTEEGPRITQDIPAESLSAVITSGEIHINEAGSRETTWLFPDVGMLGIIASSGGGVVNGSTNGYASSLTFPTGATFCLAIILPGGQLYLMNNYTTTSETVLVLPYRSRFGSLNMRDGILTGFGSASFDVQPMLIRDGSEKSVGMFGVLVFPENLNLTRPIVWSSGLFYSTFDSISAVIPIHYLPYLSVTSISMTGKDVVIFPSGPDTTFYITEGQFTSSLSLVPGSGLFFTNFQEGTASDLGDEIFTTPTTVIKFGAGTVYGVIEVGIRGNIVLTPLFRKDTTVGLGIAAPLDSVVGELRTANQFITGIGKASFVVTPVVPSISAAVGLLDVAHYLQPGPTPIDSLDPLTSSSPLDSFLSTEDPNVVPPIFPLPPVLPVDHLSEMGQILLRELVGFVEIGDTSSIGDGLETVSLSSTSVNAVITFGDIIITDSEKQTSWPIPYGSMLGIITINGPGKVTEVLNGYMTSANSLFSFPQGVTLCVLRISPDESLDFQNVYTTFAMTTVQVPNGSRIGNITVSPSGKMTNFGPAAFTVRQLLLMSELSDAPIAGSFGILQLPQTFKPDQPITVSSTFISPDVLPTISAVIPIHHTPVGSTTSLLIPPDSHLAIIPKNATGIIFSQAGYEDSFRYHILLPGQGIMIRNAEGGSITDISDGFFTTEATAMTLPAGTVYQIFEIGRERDLITNYPTNVAVSELTVFAPVDSIVGLVEFSNTSPVNPISTIGGADFTVKLIEPPASPSKVLLGILDISGFLNSQISKSAFLLTASSAFDGPYKIDCNQEKRLHKSPFDCYRFYQCYGTGEERTAYFFSCASGLVYDETSSQCVYPSSRSTCPLHLSAPLDEASSSFSITCSAKPLRFPLGTCNLFYQCSDDDGLDKKSLFVFSCREGLVFDEGTSRCLLPKEASVCNITDKVRKAPAQLFQVGRKIDPNILALVTSARSNAEVPSNDAQGRRKLQHPLDPQPRQTFISQF